MEQVEFTPFYISVSNGLLRDGHPKRIGPAVWEFMWCLDRMTSISENGVGLVLGGKPIKLKEIADMLGFHEITVSKNLKKLESEGYIRKTRLSNGIKIEVIKAKKRFSGIAKSPTRNAKSDLATSLIPSLQYQKTRSVDPAPSAELNALIEKFRPVNPNINILFRNKTERDAMARMVKTLGAEKLGKIIDALPKLIVLPYFPKPTSPWQLERDMGKLMAAVEQEKQKSNKNKVLIA